MKNWIPKKTLLTFLASAAAVSLLLYSTGLFLVLREIKKIENSYKDTESSSSKERRAHALKSIAEVNKDSIQILRDFFVKKGDEVQFIEKIEEIAESSKINFEIYSINPKEDKENSFTEDIEMTIKIEGSWNNVITFMNSLDKINFGVSFREVALDSNKPGEWSGTVDIIIYREK